MQPVDDELVPVPAEFYDINNSNVPAIWYVYNNQIGYLCIWIRWAISPAEDTRPCDQKSRDDHLFRHCCCGVISRTKPYPVTAPRLGLGRSTTYIQCEYVLGTNHPGINYSMLGFSVVVGQLRKTITRDSPQSEAKVFSFLNFCFYRSEYDS